MNFDSFNSGVSRRLSASDNARRDSYGGGGGGRQGYQMLGQGSDDEMDPYADDSRASRGRGYDDDFDDRRGSSSRGGSGRFKDGFDDDFSDRRGSARGSSGRYRDDFEESRGGRGDGDDPYMGCYSGYRGYVRARNANQGYGHVVKDEFGVDRTQSNKIKIFVSPQSIRVTDYDNEEIDNIRYTDITKIDHKHDKGMNDGHKNFLAFNLKDGSVFVINSPQTPDIKADVMEAVKRSRSVNIGSYKRNY